MKTHPAPAPFSLLRNACTLLLLMVVASGCDKDPKPAAGQATQVAAKVNADEISVHQVNNALSQLPNVPMNSVGEVRKEILSKLVNQQLAVQQAEELKLDRDPGVLMKLDSSKRDILTRAYLARVVAGLPKPTTEDARKFYASHPELFSERRIYRLQEINLVPSANAPVAELRKLAAAKSMEEIAGWLKKQNVPYTFYFGTRTAEVIPLPMLSTLAKLKDGQTEVFESPQKTTILHVESSELKPVNEETALKQIPQFLANEHAKHAITSELDRLKTKAKIEYVGEFADAAPTGTAGKEATEQKSPVAVEAGKPQLDQSIEKGIAGLK